MDSDFSTIAQHYNVYSTYIYLTIGVQCSSGVVMVVIVW